MNMRYFFIQIQLVQDALHQLKLEISENENRKDFSFSEKMKWAEELKKEYSKIAKENQGTRNDLTSSSNGQNVNTRDKIAKDLDMSNGTLARAEFIHKNGNNELIQQLDSNQLSINKAYITLKEQLQAEKEKAKELEQQLKLK